VRADSQQQVEEAEEEIFVVLDLDCCLGMADTVAEPACLLAQEKVFV